MSQPIEDSRIRPVVFQTRSDPLPRSRRRPVRVLATFLLVVAALGGATGLAFGGSAVWSVVGPKAPANEPAPLWIPAPAPIRPAARPDAQVNDRPSTGPTTTGNRGSSSGSSGDGGMSGGGGPGVDDGGGGDVDGSNSGSGGPGPSSHGGGSGQH